MHPTIFLHILLVNIFSTFALDGVGTHHSEEFYQRMGLASKGDVVQGAVEIVLIEKGMSSSVSLGETHR